MRSVVVFESMFGNTKTIAEAVADGLSTVAPVEILEVGTAPEVFAPDVALLVIGGPTHSLGLSRPDTRRTALRLAGRDFEAARTGLREWLDRLRFNLTGTAVATFDTRISRPHLPGSAARAAQRRLHRRGFRVVTAASFYVDGTEGPLLHGETRRARQWAEQVALRYYAGSSAYGLHPAG